LNKIFTFLFASVLALAFSGCATQSSVNNAAAGTGIKKIYSGDHETIKSATMASMQNLNIDVKGAEDTPDGYVITFSKPMSAFSWGEVGRVLVKKVGDNSRVYVHSEKRAKFQVTGAKEQDFANAIFASIDEILANKTK